MRCCVQWNPVYNCKDSASCGFEPRTARSVGQGHDLMSYKAPHSKLDVSAYQKFHLLIS